MNQPLKKSFMEDLMCEYKCRRRVIFRKGNANTGQMTVTYEHTNLNISPDHFIKKI